MPTKSYTDELRRQAIDLFDSIPVPLKTALADRGSLREAIFHADRGVPNTPPRTTTRSATRSASPCF
jgi:hypothetical protein